MEHVQRMQKKTYKDVFANTPSPLSLDVERRSGCPKNLQTML
jgi:hypothetical protein